MFNAIKKRAVELYSFQKRNELYGSKTV